MIPPIQRNTKGLDAAGVRDALEPGLDSLLFLVSALTVLALLIAACGQAPAATTQSSAAYANVFEVEGGFNAWDAAGNDLIVNQ